jgi:hypothetical protein
MRLLLFAILAAAAPAASTAAPDLRGPAPGPVTQPAAADDAVVSPYDGRCPAETARIAKAAKAKPEFHNLTELPDANAYSAVFRTKDGCPDPIVISYEVGRERR